MPEDVHGGEKGPLGQKVDAPDVYSPDVLFPIPRTKGRVLLGLVDANLPTSDKPLPFSGEDVWNCYELSWLNGSGVPRRAILELRVPCETPFIVESKSLKLYLNSLSFKRFASTAELLSTIVTDVGGTLGGSEPPAAILVESEPPLLDPNSWVCVDDTPVTLDPTLLDVPDEGHLVPEAASSGEPVVERLVSHVLRTLCPVTGQPDWGSVLIEYHGAPISRAGVLTYVASLRREVGFHENAIERIFLALQRGRCAPEALRVTGRFFRRGGIDINPIRQTANAEAVLGRPLPNRVPGQ